jgi:hypothetical protein
VTRPRFGTGLALLVVAVVVAGCDADAKHTSATTAATTSTSAAAPVPIAPAERPACALLFARLQRVTVALQTSSDLIAHSLNKQQLARRIAIEQVQLQRSAALMTGGPVPAALVPANQNLVSALRAFSRDFGRAKTAAARGDFRAATAAMGDAPVVHRILAASKTIETACAVH